MDLGSIKRLQYSRAQQNEFHLFPQLLIDSIQLVHDFFKNNSSNKLCIVFPSRQLAAQWISVPLTLQLIHDEYRIHEQELNQAYKQYKPGQLLLLNNEAVVAWVRGDANKLVFQTKGKKGKKYWEETQGDQIAISTTRINNLRPAPPNRKALSSKETVYENLVPRSTIPIDKLLGISSNGNLTFQRKSVCLISGFNSYEESVHQIEINDTLIDDYLSPGRVEDQTNATGNCPLIISNNLQDVNEYLERYTGISKVIIDSYKTILDRGLTEFADMDGKFKLPTILITDLSEIEAFESIGSHGFSFFSFTNAHITPGVLRKSSPFSIFESKLNRYATFKFRNIVCIDPQIEKIVSFLQKIHDDESDSPLTRIKVGLIKLINGVSRVASVLREDELEEFNVLILAVETLYLQQRNWIGESGSIVGEIIPLLKQILNRFKNQQSSKCVQLVKLLTANHYTYIICIKPTESDALRRYLRSLNIEARVISLDEIHDDFQPESPMISGLMMGWPKASNFNRILSSFVFSQLDVLFYEFENSYYNSLQRRNLRNLTNIRSTIDQLGVEKQIAEEQLFREVFKVDEIVENSEAEKFDVLSFELKLDDAQYSKYYRTSSSESVKARRIDFDRDLFVYATEPHKFIVINDLFDNRKKDKKIFQRKFDGLHTGDSVAIINTDRDILVYLVEKNTNPEEFKAVKSLTDLWKNLLKEHYIKLDNDFKALVAELRKLDCIKHPTTIRNWLHDENRIGPDDDLDLMSIALLTESQFLIDNISNVRKAIDQMVTWRFQASDYVRDKIQLRLTELKDYSVIKSSLEIQDLGKVDILRVLELNKIQQDIDKKFANRLLHREI